MATEDDYRFTTADDGCVLLEIYDDSEEEENGNGHEDNDGSTQNFETNGETPTDDCGTTNGYSSDTSSLTVNSENTANKSLSTPPSRHSSLEIQVKSEPFEEPQDSGLATCAMQVTEEIDLKENDENFSNESPDDTDEDQTPVIIKPEINCDPSLEDSMPEDSLQSESLHGDNISLESFSNPGNDMFADHDSQDDDLVATKQALSLNELFKQYRKTPSTSTPNRSTHRTGGLEPKNMRALRKESQESQNLDDLEVNTDDGVTEYIIQPKSENMMKIVDTKSVSTVEFSSDEQSNQMEMEVIHPSDNKVVCNISKVMTKEVKEGETYDRRRPNLRRLTRKHMGDDEYFDKRLKTALKEKPTDKYSKSTCNMTSTNKYGNYSKYVNNRTSKYLSNRHIVASSTTDMTIKSFNNELKIPWTLERVQCEVCEGWFAGSQSLVVHMRIHNDEKPYVCKVCGWRSRTSSAHTVHIKLHSQDKQFCCSVCDMKFYTTSMLKSHFRVHSGEKPYKCIYCSDSFAHSSTLKVHLRQHTKERPYQCTVCNKRFTQPTHLTTHSRTHTDEKPFECRFCGKKMRQSSHLKIHERIHTQERPYNCDQCTSNFMTKEHLVMHKRTHSGDHPYPCRVCGEAFTQSSARKKHEKRHVVGSQYRCDICMVDLISPRALKRHRKTHEGGEEIKQVKAKIEPKVEEIEEEDVEEEDEIEEEDEVPKEGEEEEEDQEEEGEEEEEEEVVEEEEEVVEEELKHEVIIPKVIKKEIKIEKELLPIPQPSSKPGPPSQAAKKSKRKNPLQCDICFKVFARVPNVTRHKMEIHAGFKRSSWAHTYVRKKYYKKTYQYTS